MKSKKKYGQHFLVSEFYINRISEEINSHSEFINNLLEVGPGKGALSKRISPHFKKYKAVEIDEDMVRALENQFVDSPVDIINQDFLKLDLSELFDGEPFLLAGNYPYNISSQIIFKMLDHKEQIPFMIGMFQREVAHRIVSEPGSKVYGIISVLCQLHYKGELLFDLEPEAFDPPPKVHSSVIKLVAHNDYSELKNFRLFKQVVKVSFSQRRKMLRNTLKTFFVDKAVLKEKIFLKRPEQLSIEDFIFITELISKQ